MGVSHAPPLYVYAKDVFPLHWKVLAKVTVSDEVEDWKT
jgi:uncharacterized membrane protein YqiK